MDFSVIKQAPDKYNNLVIRERILLLFLVLAVVFFIWYVAFGFSLENDIKTAESKRERLVSLSESIVEKYDVNEDQKMMDRNIAIIDKRMSSVRSKMNLIDKDIKNFNDQTIAIGEIVLLLRDLLSANQNLSLKSLKVYPSELIKKKSSDSSSFEDAFEKNVISLTLQGNYSSVFDYLKNIEALKWSVFWQDVKYQVDAYPNAIVEIHLYTLSIIEDEPYASR